MELLTAAFVTGTLLISFEGEGAGLALMAVAITIVGYQTGGPGGVAETVKGMGLFGALIFSPCVVVLSWRAMRKWLPVRVRKSPTAQQEAEGQREAARQRQAARQQDAERQRQAEREREQQQEDEMRREAARQRQAARQQDAERRRQANGNVNGRLRGSERPNRDIRRSRNRKTGGHYLAFHQTRAWRKLLEATGGQSKSTTLIVFSASLPRLLNSRRAVAKR
jgi:flagellar biosynthesis GTPase FlhF